MASLSEDIGAWRLEGLTDALAQQYLDQVRKTLDAADLELNASFQQLYHHSFRVLRKLTIEDIQLWSIARQLEETKNVSPSGQCELLHTLAQTIKDDPWLTTAQAAIKKYSSCPKCGSDRIESKGRTTPSTGGFSYPRIICNRCRKGSNLGPGTKRKHANQAAKQAAYRARQNTEK